MVLGGVASLLVAIDVFVALWALSVAGPVPSGVVRWLIPLAALPWSKGADQVAVIAVGVLGLAAGVLALARVRAAPVCLGVVGAGTLILLAAGAVKTANAVDGQYLGMEFDARAAFGSLALLCLALLVVAGAVGASREATAIAALAALALTLGAGILGPAASNYTALHRAAELAGAGVGSSPACGASGCETGNGSPSYSNADGGGSGGGPGTGLEVEPPATVAPSTTAYSAPTTALAAPTSTMGGETSQSYRVYRSSSVYSRPHVTDPVVGVVTANEYVSVSCKTLSDPVDGPVPGDRVWLQVVADDGASGFVPDQWIYTNHDPMLWYGQTNVAVC